MKSRFQKLSALCAAAVLLGGCAGYHLGPVNGLTAGDKSVEVIPFNNKTLEPTLGDAVTQAVRQRLQADGTYHLATSGEGDLVVSGEIISYSRQGLSFLSSAAEILQGKSSEYVSTSRTLLAISWAYCAPKSKMAIVSG